MNVCKAQMTRKNGSADLNDERSEKFPKPSGRKFIGYIIPLFNITKHVLRGSLNEIRNIAFYIYRDHLEPFIIILKRARSHRLALFLMLEWTRILDAVNAHFLRGKGRNFRYFSPIGTDSVKTSCGEFRIRSHSRDFLICSPVYEYGDKEYLIGLQKLRKESKRVLFVVVGALFGIYTVSTGTIFKEDDGVSIISFEPAAPSYDLLVKNIEINGLTT